MLIELAWLLPVLPLLGFIVISFITKRSKGLSALVAIGTMFVCLILSVGITVEVLKLGITMEAPKEYALQWLSLPGLTIEAGILIDPLTSVMLVVVCFIALLVDIYSLGYMKDDPGYSRYYSFLSLFAASMLGLVVANNYFQIFVFWELVGLSSYLLIGFYFAKDSAVQANKKAFIANRVADFGFMIGFFYLFLNFGTFNFGELANQIPSYANTTMITIAAILVFIGPVGKSAQFPLHVWLPDAMEGPTPVSALIHAATMVAAGVYLIARQFVLFSNSDVALIVIAYIGGFTALFAATIALVNSDIKRILAFSTLSQLGYMVMALGVGSVTAGMFHLTTHAFFKALLFLGAGSVIHAVHTNNIWDMGGLHRKMPITTWTFVIGALALAGIFPLAGFWSKDEILLVTKDAGFTGLYIMASFVAFLTAFYMFRLIFVTFFGETRTKHEVHESPTSMTVPLGILAIFSIVVGFIGAPFFKTGFGAFIYYGEPHHPVPDLTIMILSSVIALSGILLAWAIYYKKYLSASKIKNAFKPIYTILENKYYIDEIYQWFFENIVLLISKIFNWSDRNIVDGAAHGISAGFKGAGARLRFIQTGNMQNYALVLFVAVILLVIWMAIPVLGGI